MDTDSLCFHRQTDGVSRRRCGRLLYYGSKMTDPFSGVPGQGPEPRDAQPDSGIHRVQVGLSGQEAGEREGDVTQGLRQRRSHASPPRVWEDAQRFFFFFFVISIQTVTGSAPLGSLRCVGCTFLFERENKRLSFRNNRATSPKSHMLLFLVSDGQCRCDHALETQCFLGTTTCLVSRLLLWVNGPHRMFSGHVFEGSIGAVSSDLVPPPPPTSRWRRTRRMS